MDIKSKTIKTFIIAILVIHAVACLCPIIWLFCSAFKSNPEFFNNPGFIPKSFSPQNFVNAWVNGKFSVYFLNSAFYTISTIVLVDIISALAAFSMAKLKFIFVNIVFMLIVVAILIPAPGSFIQIFMMLKNVGLLGTRLGYILVMTAVNIPISVFILKGFFESIPEEILDAAKIDGASIFMTWWRVCTPLAKPAIATVSIFTLLSIWNEYIIAAVTFSDQNLMPIQQGLLTFQGQYQTRYDLLIASTAISIIPVILVYIFFNKQVLQGVTEGAVKG
ncbi:MAG: carbohydrate ABC transporter permease [Lachnospiraceae bacterium]